MAMVMRRDEQKNELFLFISNLEHLADMKKPSGGYWQPIELCDFLIHNFCKYVEESLEEKECVVLSNAFSITLNGKKLNVNTRKAISKGEQFNPESPVFIKFLCKEYKTSVKQTELMVEAFYHYVSFLIEMMTEHGYKFVFDNFTMQCTNQSEPKLKVKLTKDFLNKLTK